MEGMVTEDMVTVMEDTDMVMETIIITMSWRMTQISIL